MLNICRAASEYWNTHVCWVLARAGLGPAGIGSAPFPLLLGFRWAASQGRAPTRVGLQPEPGVTWQGSGPGSAPSPQPLGLYWVASHHDGQSVHMCGAQALAWPCTARQQEGGSAPSPSLLSICWAASQCWFTGAQHPREWDSGSARAWPGRGAALCPPPSPLIGISIAAQ